MVTGASLMAQQVKNLPAMQDTQVQINKRIACHAEDLKIGLQNALSMITKASDYSTYSRGQILPFIKPQ